MTNDNPDWSQQLRDSTFLRSVEHHRELESTNDRALALMATAAPRLPALILADRQTAGRGRGANRWWAGEGALTFSLVVDGLEADAGGPSRSCDPRIALWTGIAVARSLQAECPSGEVQLKWPNDVWLNGRKIGGILIEPPAGRPGVAVIGIGLNVNNSLQSAPAEFRETATSLRDVSGREHCRQSVLVELLKEIERLFANRNATNLPDTWDRYCALRGGSIAFTLEQGETTGICRGVQPDGALRVETPSGIRAIYSATQVRPVGTHADGATSLNSCDSSSPDSGS